jgi:tRNA pseudouridine55 synthase
LLLLNKQPGVTSFGALAEVKRVFNTGKVGHTGTLDKFAGGLLVVLCGKALKLVPWFSRCDKQYLGSIRFGIETDTLDTEGSPIAEAAVPSREAVEQILCQFTGEIMQEPPAYSAIHVNGQRASALARGGEMPAMKKRPIHIFRLELRSWEPPCADIFVHCSSGTYIRSLARNIALAAGSRGHLAGLLRTRIAGFRLEDAWQGEGTGSLTASLHPLDKQLISGLGIPWIEVSTAEAEDIIHGKPLFPVLGDKPLFSSRDPTSDFQAAVFCGGTLLAMIEKAGGKWNYGHVFGLTPGTQGDN